MRQLKYHEKKLLRKVDLYSWKGEDNLRVAKVMRRYHIQNRADYTAYHRICGQVTRMAAKLETLPAEDSFRIAMTDQFLAKLYNMGVIHKSHSKWLTIFPFRPFVVDDYLSLWSNSKWLKPCEWLSRGSNRDRYE
jgi:hypothetical protein